MKVYAAALLFVPLLIPAPVHALANRPAASAAVEAGALVSVARLAKENDYGALINLVEKGSPETRAQAQYALINMGGRAVPDLLHALDKREYVPELVYVLNGIKDGRSAGPLAKLLNLKDKKSLEPVKNALFSLGSRSVPYLFAAIEDPARCRPAAKVLASIKAPDYRKKLKNYLKDKRVFVRRAATEVELSWLDPSARADMEGLLGDKNVQIRRAASAYFLAFAPNFSVKDLPALLKDPDADVRKNSVQLATKLRDVKCFRIFSEILLGDPDPKVRALSAEAVFRCGENGQAVAPLIAALKDKDAFVAAAAARRLGALKAAQALVPLQELLENKGKQSDDVVDAVAGALADIGIKFNANILLPYINWNNLYVVRSVIRAWNVSASPQDVKVKEALRNYIKMPVDDRYKNKVRTLLGKLGQV